MKIKGTVVFEKVWKALHSNKRFIECVGGSRSSKSYSICQSIILYCLQNNDTTFSVIRKTMPALKASIMRDFFEILKDLGLYEKAKHNKSENIYTFENGSMVEFFSADDEQKLRGRKRTFAFVNEANELLYEDFQQLALRTEKKIMLDYNPSESNSWIYQIPDEKKVFIHSTYKDNPFLTKEIVEQIESYKDSDPDYYQIFALGKRVHSKQNVYHKWNQLDKKPDYMVDFLYGIDFGYTHPTALVKIWYNMDRNEIYIEEMIYESHLTSQMIIDRMVELGIEIDVPIVADTARPEIIKDIRDAGFNIYKAIKDVRDGIMNVKSFKVNVSSEATNVIKENENYKFKKVNGKITEDVIKLWDDAMDAIRYAVFHIKKHHSPSNDGEQVYSFDF